MDGSVWMIYHGNQVSGTGREGRSVWIAPVVFDDGGMPHFGRPEPEVLFPVPKNKLARSAYRVRKDIIRDSSKIHTERNTP